VIGNEAAPLSPAFAEEEVVSMLQSFVWYGSLIGIAAVAAVFASVALRAPSAGDAARVEAGVVRLRSRLAWILGVAFVPITGLSLWAAPLYNDPRVAGGERVVEVVGHQWFWKISESRLPADATVAFHVTSADVNHGFAIYDEDLRVVAQTQAMPGYVNVLRVRFPRPGSYRVLCLEYCGLVHHGMAASLEVVASAGGTS
jgi:cytochrome c oxidase subunit II